MMRKWSLSYGWLLSLFFWGTGLAAPQTLSQPEMLALLKSEDFAQLEASYSHVQRAYRDGEITSEELRNAFRVFYDANPLLRAHYDRWEAQYPKSYVAHLARGIYFKYRGIEARGEAFIRDTSEEQLRGMREAHAESAKSLYASFGLDPKPILSYAHAIDVNNYAGNSQECRRLLDLALRVEPKNVFVREKYLSTLQTRWGGSVQEMSDFYAESQAAGVPEQDLRRFKSLIAEEIGWVAQHHQGDYAAAAEAYRKAAELGANSCLACDAYSLADEGKIDEAIEILDSVLKQTPQDKKALIYRAALFHRTGKMPEYVRDLKAAASLGDAQSQLNLGVAYVTGLNGVLEKDFAAGLELFRTVAASHGPESVIGQHARLNLEAAEEQIRHPEVALPVVDASAPPGEP